MFDKQQYRVAKKQINRVLWEVWDPIGARKAGGPDDEYESYADTVYGLLARDASDHEIAEHLLRITRDSMGIDNVTTAEMMPTVAALRAISLRSDSR